MGEQVPRISIRYAVKTAAKAVTFKRNHQLRSSFVVMLKLPSIYIQPKIQAVIYCSHSKLTTAGLWPNPEVRTAPISLDSDVDPIFDFEARICYKITLVICDQNDI
jgi:hypothetical protein